MLSDQVLKDLHDLGILRCEAAANSVTQLFDNRKQEFDFLIELSTIIAASAAALLQENAHNKTGGRPHIASCFGHVLVMIGERGGAQTRIVGPDEADKYGFKP